MVTRLLAALACVSLSTAAPALAADMADGSDSTPLLMAVTKGDLALVNKLLKSGANPNVKNKLSTTPLLEAAFQSHGEIVKALIEAGADPNVAGPDGQTALMLLARGDNVAAAKLLLDKGANPKAR